MLVKTENFFSNSYCSKMVDSSAFAKSINEVALISEARKMRTNVRLSAGSSCFVSRK